MPFDKVRKHCKVDERRWPTTGAIGYIAAVPDHLLDLVWLDTDNLEWDAQPGLTFHAYRDDLAQLGYGFHGTQRDDLIAGGGSANALVDIEEPAPGVAWFYLISADDNGDEGSLGLATCSERCNTPACH